MRWEPESRVTTPIKMNFNDLYGVLLGRRASVCGAGPEKFARLLERLGNPQTRYRIIHVAGTNGKGSVCHLCAEALQCAGYKTGLFTSPHLFSPTERIRINGRLVDKRTFVRLCQNVLTKEEEKLNFFEILTAAAFLYFSQERVQYAVMETGLGGRKDPTNVAVPCVSIITSIGLDHCALLGGTLAQIAKEKAGIIKPRIPVFCPPLAREVSAVITDAARSVGAPLSVVQNAEPFTCKKIDWNKGCMLLQKGKALWPLHLLGEKQPQNAALAYRACRYLGIVDEALKKAFARVFVPCRFETIIQGNTLFIFDGAHNPPAVQALTEFFARSPWKGQAALVCGFMKDKDYREMLRLFGNVFSALYVTAPRTERAASLSDVRMCLPRKCKASFFSSPSCALRAAAKTHHTVVVAGSFYLAGYLRARKGLTGQSDCD